VGDKQAVENKGVGVNPWEAKLPAFKYGMLAMVARLMGDIMLIFF